MSWKIAQRVRQGARRVSAGVLTLAICGCAGVWGVDRGEALGRHAVVAGGEAGEYFRQMRPPFRGFSAEDERLLEAVSLGAWRTLWEQVDPDSGLVYDRTSGTVVSVAGVGFQLASLPIGVERGWVGRAEAEARAVRVLRSLREGKGNRKAGLYFHFLEGDGSASAREFEMTVSTVDSAILFAGACVAASAFGGEVAALAEAMFAEADWTFFVDHEVEADWAKGGVSLGWQPADAGDPTGEGTLLGYHWLDAACEARLVVFMGMSTPVEQHRLAPEAYWRLRRPVGEHSGEAIVFNPYAGALFTQQYAHLFIDYASMGADDPGAHGFERVRVDWWENSRRFAAMHRERTLAAAGRSKTFAAGLWGLSASDTPGGYAVAGLHPKRVRIPGDREGWDDPGHEPVDEWGDGTVSLSAAVGTVLFEPGPAMALLRRAMALRGSDGALLAWSDPAEGGRGLSNAVNLGGAEPWAAPDRLAIDDGSLLLAIENARTGLVWRLFHRHPAVRGGMERLGLEGSEAEGQWGREAEWK